MGSEQVLVMKLTTIALALTLGLTSAAQATPSKCNVFFEPQPKCMAPTNLDQLIEDYQAHKRFLMKEITTALRAGLDTEASTAETKAHAEKVKVARRMITFAEIQFMVEVNMMLEAIGEKKP
jgi:hypothetical protein